jgi:hypothetical protein
VHSLSAFGENSPHRLETNLSNFDWLVIVVCRFVRVTNRSADSGDQFSSSERLGDIIVGTQIERSYFILFLVAHGEHEDRQPTGKGADAGSVSMPPIPGIFTSSKTASYIPDRSSWSASSPREASIT